MPRYFLEVSYMGTRYSGFQIQKNSNTIQHEVENALMTKFRKSVNLTGSSRTDAGVHARQNYFHFDLSESLSLVHETANVESAFQNIVYSLNSILPWDIAIKRIFEVAPEAHSRFDAISREYRYYIYQEKNPFCRAIAYFYPYQINIDRMQEAAKIVLETKDFTSFSKRHTQVKTFLCSITKSEWTNENNFLMYEVVGDRFLRGMVRGLVGTMLRVGREHISMESFKEIINGHDCKKVDFSVPPHGLFLEEVRF
jgi:tRNA pseudouridine38-40 synthase